MLIHTEQIVSFLNGLRRESGGYAESFDSQNSIRSTLSVVKTLIELGKLPISNAMPWVVDFICGCRNENGGFAISLGREPSPYDTANGLIGLSSLGQKELLEKFLPSGLAFMEQTAATQFDHFMLVATYEECGVKEPVPQKTINFFMERIDTSLNEKKIDDTAIAAASLLRAGYSLSSPESVAELLLSGQNTSDGGFGEQGESSLFITYCVMRTLALLNKLPNTIRLSSYLASLKTDLGYSDSKAGKTTAGAIYMNIGIQNWLHSLQSIPIEMARNGDIIGLEKWLTDGGEPDLYDADGWTVLLAAAAYGRSEAVNLLLNHSIQGAPRANPELRFKEADALPIYMAGQNGDLETVKLLLDACPGHVHKISSVNGHTILLQAAFYGKEKHMKLASYLLDNAAKISRRPLSENENEQEKLLTATNVRGYSSLGMQDLWHNTAMKELLSKYYPDDKTSERFLKLEAQTREYYQYLLLKIASPQTLTEELITEISRYLSGIDMEYSTTRIDAILKQPHFKINRLGSHLQMTPLIFALTGTDNGEQERAQRRHCIVKKLLDAGADPKIREKHPMGVGAVIRASVLNHFKLLQLLANYLTSEDFTAEINISPAVNGLTAMHDAIHRALTSPANDLDNHINQIKWMLSHGARLDIIDNVGQTAYQLAESALTDNTFPKNNTRKVWDTINKRG